MRAGNVAFKLSKFRWLRISPQSPILLLLPLRFLHSVYRGRPSERGGEQQNCKMQDNHTKMRQATQIPLMPPQIRWYILLWCRALHVTWCSPILSWPRIMFSKRACYDFSTDAINAVKRVFWVIWLTNRVFWVMDRVFWVMNIVFLFFCLMFSIVSLFSMFSNLGLQDSTICRALLW